MRIFLADDEKHALKYLFDCLTELRPEAELVSFDRSDEALEYIRKDAAFDVAFLDISMPVINGVELAKELKKLNPTINIVFCTAHEQYAMDAVKLRVSGYVCKPYVKENIETELENLLHPITEKDSRFYVRTFGTFDFFVDGVPLHFKRSKSKEMLAYLVSIRGASATRKDLTAILFGDKYNEQTQNYFSKIYKDLVETLKGIGAGNIVRKSFNTYSVNTALFSCDLYDYDKGDPAAINAYKGEFMFQYDWAVF